jgi:hypothetical protein
MMIEITTSGGFAGIGTGAGARVLDLVNAEQAARESYCAAFDPKVLAVLSETAPIVGAADMFSYHIVVTDKDGKRHVFDFREDQLTPEMLDLIDAI